MKFCYVLLAFLTVFSFAYGAGEIGCNNTKDLDTFIRENATMHDKLDKCATRCLAAYGCSRACIIKDIGLTPECAGCFATDMGCMSDKCMSICLPDHSSEKCLECHETNCMPATVACAHVPREVIPR